MKLSMIIDGEREEYPVESREYALRMIEEFKVYNGQQPTDVVLVDGAEVLTLETRWIVKE